MKVSELIMLLGTILDTHGDIDVLDPDHFTVSGVSVDEATIGQKCEWDIPDENFVYAQIKSNR